MVINVHHGANDIMPWKKKSCVACDLKFPLQIIKVKIEAQYHMYVPTDGLLT